MKTIYIKRNDCLHQNFYLSPSYIKKGEKKKEKKGKGFINSIKSDIKIPENISNTLVTPWGRMSDTHPHKGTNR